MAVTNPPQTPGSESNGTYRSVSLNAPESNVRISEALRQKFPEDPAFETKGMPPGYGQWALPHVLTLQGLVTTISRVYRISDEALNDSFDNARFMEYDVGILECLEARIRSSILLDWHIDPEDPKDQMQVFVCAELTKIVKSVDRWQQVLEQLTRAIWPGRSAVSFHYGWKQVSGNWYIAPVEDGLGGPSWIPIHGDKLVFRLMDGRLDHLPNQVGIRVGQTYYPEDRISKGPGYENQFWQIEPTDRGLAYFLDENERKQLLIHKHQIQDAAFERPTDAGRVHGVGLRSQLYWEWFMEKNTLQWLMEYIERSAFGLELWYYPLGNEKARQDAETAVKNRVGPYKNVIFAPVPAEEGPGKQYGVDHVETGAQGADILLSIIKDFFGARRKRLILGQVLTTEAEATGLGGNLASIHLLSFRDIIKYDSKNRDETVSWWVNLLKNWNFPGNGHWTARYTTETEPVDADSKLTALQTSQSMGAPISVASIYKAAGITPPEPDDVIASAPGAMMAGPGGAPPPGGMGGEDENSFDPQTDPNAPEDVQQFSQTARYAEGGQSENPILHHPDYTTSGKEFGTVHHGGQEKITRVDPERLNSRDAGYYGRGFYVSRTPSGAKFYGRTISKFDLHPKARVLMSALHSKEAHPSLVEAVRSHGEQRAAARGKQKEFSDEWQHTLKSPIGWKSSVDEFANHHKFDAVHHSSGEVVIKNHASLIPHTKKDQYSDPDLRHRIELAANHTHLDPTKGQREAGNYRKGKVSIHGVDVVIENPKGSYRKYKFEGKKGKQELKHHYGYISRTEGSDDGQLDCFIGPDPESDLVYIIDQINPRTGEFDELKVLLGWYCEKEAKEGYLANYEKDWGGLGKIVPMTIQQFKEWLEKGDQTKAMEKQKAFYSGPMFFGGEWF